MMAIINEDDSVRLAFGSWHNSSDWVITITREYNTVLFLRLSREIDT